MLSRAIDQLSLNVFNSDLLQVKSFHIFGFWGARKADDEAVAAVLEQPATAHQLHHSRKLVKMFEYCTRAYLFRKRNPKLELF